MRNLYLLLKKNNTHLTRQHLIEKCLLLTQRTTLRCRLTTALNVLAPTKSPQEICTFIQALGGNLIHLVPFLGTLSNLS